MSKAFIQDRETSRRFFLEVWKKYKNGSPMQPMEELIRHVILEHPEYHDLLSQQEDAISQDFTPELGQTNPFLHMGMHIAIREQVASDRPVGISALYQKLLPKHETTHNLEHQMMECLGEVLWLAQCNNTLPDESAYLECISKINRH
jgi:hypothetical protein